MFSLMQCLLLAAIVFLAIHNNDGWAFICLLLLIFGTETKKEEKD